MLKLIEHTKQNHFVFFFLLLFANTNAIEYIKLDHFLTSKNDVVVEQFYMYKYD